MKYLLDTDHISILQRGTGAEFAALAARLAKQSPTDFAFCVVSLHEQVLGAHTYLSRARNARDLVHGYNRLGQVFQSFAAAPMLPFDAAAGAVYDGLIAQRIRIATMDLRIAAITLSRNLILLTRNVRDFGLVPGLVTEDWTV